MLNKPKYKLVAVADGYDYKAGDVLTQSDEQQSYGGPWGWMMQDGKAEWQEVVATPDEIKAQTKQQMTQFVQSLLDAEAQKHNYDNIVSATSYAGYANQFQAEGIAFGVWRSAVWAKCYEIMEDVLSGERQVPTEEQLLAELPKLTL